MPLPLEMSVTSKGEADYILGLHSRMTLRGIPQHFTHCPLRYPALQRGSASNVSYTTNRNLDETYTLISRGNLRSHSRAKVKSFEKAASVCRGNELLSVRGVSMLCAGEGIQYLVQKMDRYDILPDV